MGIVEEETYRLAEKLEYRVHLGDVEERIAGNTQAAAATSATMPRSHDMQPVAHWPAGRNSLRVKYDGWAPRWDTLSRRKLSTGAGVAQARGTPLYMEDAFLATPMVVDIGGKPHAMVLHAVFDGHAGRQAAKMAMQHLPGFLDASIRKYNAEVLTNTGFLNALKLGFKDLDDLICNGTPQQPPIGTGRRGHTIGTTANASLIVGNEVWIANLGDSRAILVDDEGFQCASEDADPNVEKYARGVRRRDKNALIRNGEVGTLGMTRSLGDGGWGARVSGRPKVSRLELKQDPARRQGCYLVHVSDGIGHGTNPQDLADFVRARAQAGKSPQRIAADLVHASSRHFDRDNMTAMVVPLFKQMHG
jgi:serine/threonine protein phosphatase PrpC